jgi:hypothetical protein
MRSYKAIKFNGEDYSVPVEFKYLSQDSDGEITAWKSIPQTYFQDSKGVNGFWCKGGESEVLDEGGVFQPYWKESLYIL